MRAFSSPTDMRIYLLLCVVFVLVGSAAAEEFSEADIKKMKIKELRKFLDDRGLECAKCEEKGDFVDMAKQHLKTPVLASKQKKPIPKVPLWEAWSGIAKEVCLEKNKGEPHRVCDSMATATDSMFMQYGKRTATKLKKKPDALLKTSWGDVYQQAGKKMLGRLANYCLKRAETECGTTSKVQSIMENDNKIKGVEFVKYLTNVGIENTNPMYEALKDKALHDEL